MPRKKKDEVLLIENKENSNIDIEEIKQEIKDELKAYFEDYNERRLLEELEKSNRRLIKIKNRKIIVRDIIIVLLLGGMIFSIYVLYKKNILSQLIKAKLYKEEIALKEDKKNNSEVEKVPTQEELQKKYSYLLDNYNLGENSRYLNSFYNGELSEEVKKEMTLNSISEKDILDEDEYSCIDEDVFKKKFNELFKDGYNQESFVYDGNKIRFISKYGQYISDKIIVKSVFISKKIKKITEENQNVFIITSEKVNNQDYEITYIFENNKLISIKSS